MIVLPYLTRVLGPEKFGLIAFAQAFIEYFNVMIDYGFNLTATRAISVNNENKSEVNRIFSNVFFTKGLLLGFSMIIMILVVSLFTKFRMNQGLYYFSASMVLGHALFPIWYFQGIEKMKYISIMNLIAKLIFTVCIFIFVRDKSDFMLVPLLNGLGFISVGLISLFIIFHRYKITLFLPSFRDIKITLKEGFAIFISNLAPNLYNNSSTFLLGFFSNNVITGYFSGITKITNFFNTVAGVLSQTFYPFLSKEKKAFNKFLFLMLFTGFFMSLFVLIFNRLLVHFLLGEEFAVTRKYLMVFSVTVYQISSINGFRNYFLIHMKDSLIRDINIIVSIAGFFIMLFFTWFFDIWGAIIGLIITRFLLSATYFYYYRKSEHRSNG
ncbi:MAG: oligosaccharide flippase family protein [Bacteroidales bacterium]|nr:oligosaccharide flippase family protein [Bacteroidales bacterium]